MDAVVVVAVAIGVLAVESLETEVVKLVVAAAIDDDGALAAAAAAAGYCCEHCC